jgi:hypothetical protein
MEVALRAINLLIAFEVLKSSKGFDFAVLNLFLQLFHQHGSYITKNLEFSYIATSNHYLSDLAGLLWLGVMLPEFRQARHWNHFALRQMLLEMEKQVLPDGANFEASTGYHRFVLELFLYSFILCRQNKIEIEPRYWDKLKSMLEYVRGFLRPDCLAPLIGDTDGGQVVPLVARRADEHAHVLHLGAVLFEDPALKLNNDSGSREMLWVFGEHGVKKFKQMPTSNERRSIGFRHAGTYVMRHDDLYLCFNANDAGINGRGSHGHNDALSFELAAGDQPFIVDPGTFVYSADLKQRHLFRSTAYHSTARVDGEEQNTTVESVPFVIGNEAKPRVLVWETSEKADRIEAEHSGYTRLKSPVVHRRTIVFDKSDRRWSIDDELITEGVHEYEVWFHFAPGLAIQVENNSVRASSTSSSIILTSLNLSLAPELVPQATSRHYGARVDSMSVCWRVSGKGMKLSWRLEVEK